MAPRRFASALRSPVLRVCARRVSSEESTLCNEFALTAEIREAGAFGSGSCAGMRFVVTTANAKHRESEKAGAVLIIW
jgi:hypothetical protein